jgi:hypothetical protein
MAAMLGAAAEVPKKYSNSYSPWVFATQLAPAAAKQAKYPSCPEAEKAKSGV